MSKHEIQPSSPLVLLSSEEARYARKIIPQDMLPLLRKRYKGKQVAIVSGCFDILHDGHTDFLTFGKETSDVLVVGINCDESVKALKGENRPIIPIERRAKVIAAFGMVDHVFVFCDLDISRHIRSLLPDMYITSRKSIYPGKPEIVIAQELGIPVFTQELRGDEDSSTGIIHRVLTKHSAHITST